MPVPPLCRLTIAITLVAACSTSSTAPGTTREPPDAGMVDGPTPDRIRNDANEAPAPAFWDLERDGLPTLVTADYIELDKVAAVSLFRSSMGHNYWDDFERCRSMKHYFVPSSNEVAGTIRISAPFDAEVERIAMEWAGVQIHLRSRTHPAFTAILFHVAALESLTVGQQVAAGAPLGSHVGAQTGSDIAIAVSTAGGRRLVSYVDLMTATVWEAYARRGLPSRRDLVITREERDADPLTCEGERFVTTGSLPQRRELLAK